MQHKNKHLSNELLNTNNHTESQTAVKQIFPQIIALIGLGLKLTIIYIIPLTRPLFTQLIILSIKCQKVVKVAIRIPQSKIYIYYIL